jgi:hypothetical protein
VISPALAIEAGSKAFRSVWQRQIEAAEEAYEPGLFTGAKRGQIYFPATIGYVMRTGFREEDYASDGANRFAGIPAPRSSTWP